jgi:hypothetical protein
MKIPGLVFITIPIIFWKIWLHLDDIISWGSEFINDITFLNFILITIFYTGFSTIVEFILRDVFNADNEDIRNYYCLTPFKIIYKILIFINEKLSLKI